MVAKHLSPRVIVTIVSSALYLFVFTFLFMTTIARTEENSIRRAPQTDSVMRPEVATLQSDAKFFQKQLGGIADSIAAYYAENARRLWLNGNDVHSRTEAWIEVLERADEEGLTPMDYDPDGIRWAMNQVEEDGYPAHEFEVRMTATVLEYARDVSTGRFDPAAHGIPWHTDPPSLQVTLLLDEIASSGSGNAKGIARDLSPNQEGYRELRNALARYRDREPRETLTLIPEGGTLERGEAAPVSRLHAIHQRLETLGYDAGRGYPEKAPDTASALFDDDLADALEQFQSDYGIEDDGTLGPVTLGELNRSDEERIRTIELNLERWRWIPRDLGQKYIEVNIAGYRLEAHAGGAPVLDMGVVVGEKSWSTPSFAAAANQVIFNPHWNVPESIAEAEVIPEMLEDDSYLTDRQMVVLDRETQEVVDPSEVDWEEDAAKYMFRQESGPLNPLGGMKVLFPNEFDVYLHDTSKPRLFDETQRAFSHGCVRISDPVGLGAFLLADEGWTRAEVENAYNSSERQPVPLNEPVPVYILYWTAFVDEAGELRFRPDVYGMDDQLSKALVERPGGHDTSLPSATTSSLLPSQRIESAGPMLRRAPAPM